MAEDNFPKYVLLIAGLVFLFALISLFIAGNKPKEAKYGYPLQVAEGNPCKDEPKITEDENPIKVTRGNCKISVENLGMRHDSPIPCLTEWPIFHALRCTVEGESYDTLEEACKSPCMPAAQSVCEREMVKLNDKGDELDSKLKRHCDCACEKEPKIDPKQICPKERFEQPVTSGGCVSGGSGSKYAPTYLINRILKCYCDPTATTAVIQDQDESAVVQEGSTAVQMQ